MRIGQLAFSLLELADNARVEMLDPDAPGDAFQAALVEWLASQAVADMVRLWDIYRYATDGAEQPRPSALDIADKLMRAALTGPLATSAVVRRRWISLAFQLRSNNDDSPMASRPGAGDVLVIVG